jgi:hypothetical protein
LGGTINGSISAYNTTKGYTPRFVQYGAELIERNIGSPMVNTVSSVGRRTGMEQNIRRYLGEQGRRPSDLEAGDDESSRKRQRRISPIGDAMDVDDALASRTRATSRSSYAESLPAYDDQRSPNYEESAIAPASSNGKQPQHQHQQDRRVAWSTQLIMTTSGLGAALSESSLRSLKICLGLLRSATTHIDTIMRSLKLVLEEYEAALNSRRLDVEARSDDKLNGTMAQMGLVDSTQDAQVRIIAAPRFGQLCSLSCSPCRVTRAARYRRTHPRLCARSCSVFRSAGSSRAARRARSKVRRAMRSEARIACSHSQKRGWI